MRGRRLERQVSSYLDGALEGGEHDRIAHLIETDPEAMAATRRHRALSNGIRVAWTEGPAAPDHANLMASIRAEMTRIDAEIAERPTLAFKLGALREAFRPLRVPVLAGTAAAVAFLMFVALPQGPGTAPIALAQETIYDLESDDGAVMIFESDEGEGATIIYVVDERDGLSRQPLPTLDWSDYLSQGLA